MNLRLTIVFKLTLVFVLFAAAVLVGVSVLAFQNGRVALQAATISELLATAIEKQAALNAWVADREGDMGSMSASVHLQEEVANLIATSDPAARKAARDHVVADLRNWIGAAHDIRELLIVEPENGKVLAATDASEEGKFKEDRPYFGNGKSGVYVQNPYYDLALLGPTMTIAAPIRSGDGRLLAVLAGHLDMQGLNAIIVRRTGLHRTDDAFLVNTSNLFITQPRLVADPAVLQRGIHTEAVERCLARNSGTIAANDYRGIPALIVYRWLPERQLCLIAKIDQAEAFAAERSLGGAILTVAIFVLLFASVLAFALARTITRPVRALQAGAARFGQGDLDYRLKVGVRDEIGQLAGAMNDMAASLRQSLGQTARGHRLLAALSQAAQSVQRARSPEEIYRIVGDEVAALGYHASVFTLTEDRSHLAVTYLNFQPDVIRAAEKLTGLSMQDFRYPLTPGSFYARVMAGGKTVFSEPAAESIADALSGWQRALAGPLAALLNIRQAIYAPLTVGSERFGLLTVTGADLTEADAPAITTFANQTAIALESVRLYQEAQQRADELARRVNELNALNTMASIVNQSLDVEEILNRAMDETLRQVGVEAAAMFLLDAEAGELALTAHRGVSAKMVNAASRIKLGEGMGGKVAQTGTPMVIGSGSGYSGALKTFYEKEHLEAGASVPLIGSTGVIGVMSLATTALQYFDAAGVELLMHLGRQIAIGVEKARLYAETRAWATELEQRVAAQTAQIQYQASLVANVSDAIIGTDMQFNVESWNAAAEALYGWTAAEVIGQSFAKFVQNEYVTGSREETIRAVTEQGSWQGEVTQNRRDGTRFPVLASVSLVKDAQGQPAGFVAVNRDITERKRMEQALQDNMHFVESITNATPDIIYVYDLIEQRPVYNNRHVAAVLGYTPAEIQALGASFLPTHIHPDDWPHVLDTFCRYPTASDSDLIEVEYRMKNAQGEWRWFADRNMIFTRAADGAPQQIIGTSQEITARKQVEEKLKALATELARSNAELEHFAYVASHDLQEPLRMVSGFMGLLAQRYQGQLDADADEFIGFAIDGAKRMQRLIDGLLDYSRVGTRGQPFQSADATAALDDALWNLDLAIQDAGATVTHDPLPTVMADHDQLAQVFQNLIGNGIKFRGAEPPRVHISARLQIADFGLQILESTSQSESPNLKSQISNLQSTWLFSVRDNGIGIAAGDIGRIFGIFQRLHAQAEYPGTGIGLATCKKIVDRHGGRIWVESELGQGTTFFFTMPASGSKREA